MKSQNKKINIAFTCAALTMAVALSGCSESVARRDTISPSFGNALASNTALQMVDPWPKYVENTRIRTDGTKASNAIDSYRAPPTDEGTQSNKGMTVEVAPKT